MAGVGGTAILKPPRSPTCAPQPVGLDGFLRPEAELLADCGGLCGACTHTVQEAILGKTPILGQEGRQPSRMLLAARSGLAPARRCWPSTGNRSVGDEHLRAVSTLSPAGNTNAFRFTAPRSMK